MTTPIFPQVNPATGALPAPTEARYAAAGATTAALNGKASTADVAAKVSKSGDTMTGALLLPTPTAGDNSTKAATTAFVATALTGVVTGSVTKASVGLGNVDNTSDAAKPVSTAQADAINARLPTSARGAAAGVASLDGAAHHALAELYPGTILQLTYSSGSWRDGAGNAVAARPSPRTDLRFWAIAPAGITRPAWLIANDLFETYA